MAPPPLEKNPRSGVEEEVTSIAPAMENRNAAAQNALLGQMNNIGLIFSFPDLFAIGKALNHVIVGLQLGAQGVEVIANPDSFWGMFKSSDQRTKRTRRVSKASTTACTCSGRV